MINESFLSSLLKRYYPLTAIKVQELMSSSVLLEKLLSRAYASLDASIQKYAALGSRIRVLARLLDAWRLKKYQSVSRSTIFISIMILLYWINPIDLLPDFIPIIGGLDDVLLLNYLLKIIDSEIEKFIKWETKFKKNTA